MASSERTLSRACCGRGMALDGSYLDPDSSRRTVCTQAFRGGPPSMPSCCSQQASGSSEQCTAGANSCLQGGWSELVSEMHLNKELAIGRCDAPEPTCSCENETKLDAGHRGILPPADRRDWEEKRQRLLLQKKQLEVERERLQARLAQQEERLLKQNQELRESRLNYSKIQQAATELEQTFNKIAPTKVAQASVVVESEPGDGSVQTVKGSVRQPVNDVQPQTCNGSVQPPEHRPSHELSCATKKDTATSPVQPTSFQKSSPPPVPLNYPRTPKPSKLDSSLIELLDIFSPCENTDRNKLVSTAHRSLTVPHQAFSVARTSLLPPRGRMQASQEEMQESQILEDIFFIC